MKGLLHDAHDGLAPPASRIVLGRVVEVRAKLTNGSACVGGVLPVDDLASPRSRIVLGRVVEVRGLVSGASRGSLRVCLALLGLARLHLAV